MYNIDTNFDDLIKTAKSITEGSIEEQKFNAEKEAKKVKELLAKNKVKFNKVVFDDKVHIVVGMNYPDSLFDKIWGVLEDNGYDYGKYGHTEKINVVGSMSGRGLSQA